MAGRPLLEVQHRRVPATAAWSSHVDQVRGAPRCHPGTDGRRASVRGPRASGHAFAMRHDGRPLCQVLREMGGDLLDLAGARTLEDPPLETPVSREVLLTAAECALGELDLRCFPEGDWEVPLPFVDETLSSDEIVYAEGREPLSPGDHRPELEFLFALHRRPRPYNKYLEWELARYPLPGWDTGVLLHAVGRISAAGDVSLQRRVFARVEQAARDAGHGEVLDAWGDGLDLMRPQATDSGTT